MAAADPAAKPASASAAARPAAADVHQMVTDDCARARQAGKTCVLEVGAEDVGGAAPTAGDTGIRVLTFHPGPSLIRLRHDFIPEILKTAEDL
ncbi:MAG TPA: hypothetical protein VH165_31215 [Kofleriaceae bacterium]|nr:hypothetical protein [Kofleriaceae bacterium]